MAATTSRQSYFLLPPATYGPIPVGPFLPPCPSSRGRETSARRRPSTASGSLDRRSAAMGLNFKEKVPGITRRISKSKPRVPSPEATHQNSPLQPVDKPDGGCSPKIGSRFLSGSLRRVKKQRSTSGFVPSVDGDVPSLVLDATSPTIPTFPTNDHLPPVPPMPNKKMSVVLEADDVGTQDEEKVDRFQCKNHFLIKSGMKHHPYPDEAPYMQAYDPILLDNDRFTELLLRRLNLNGSPTFHDYGAKPPSNVLDLGCGHGRWVVEAATAWKSFGTKVTGFDLVNVSGHSRGVDGAPPDNVTWVQGNFLKYRLPFADRSFDLVRMANLSLAIPHDKWLRVFSEVRRVLTPGGRLELIDDQICFPYDENPVPFPTATHHNETSTSSLRSDSDYDTDNTGASSTLVDHHSSADSALKVRDDMSLTNSSNWEDHATTSKGLETVFENMLFQKYGIHSRPQDIIDVVLSHVFGSKHADRTKVMHLALDPGDADKMAGMVDTDISIKADQSLDEKSKDETMNMEVEQRGRDGSNTPEWPNQTASFEPYSISPKAACLLGINPTDQANGDENFPVQVQVQESISEKPLGRLKISPSIVWRERWSGRARNKHASLESLHSEVPESVSPKAAERLGITQGKRQSWESKQSQSSQLDELMPIDRHPIGRRSADDVSDPISPKTSRHLGTTSSFGVVQSPGLILWPSTFIPVEPLELEMHACKNMHVLLGCKAALWDFIQDVKGEDGKAHISQDEFNELTWEYECFRRKRFNWPAEISHSRPVISRHVTTRHVTTPRPATVHPATSPGNESFFRRPKSSSGRPNSSAGPQSSTIASPYKREDLTFVRVFRIYEACRVDEQENK